MCNIQELPLPTKAQLPPGHRQDWGTQKSLNRLRRKVGRCKTNMKKWVYTDDDDIKSDCGTSPQSMPHLLRCPALEEQCCIEDMMATNERVVRCTQSWPNIRSRDSKQDIKKGKCVSHAGPIQSHCIVL